MKTEIKSALGQGVLKRGTIEVLGKAQVAWEFIVTGLRKFVHLLTGTSQEPPENVSRHWHAPETPVAKTFTHKPSSRGVDTRDGDGSGQFYFRQDILDRMDMYQKLVRRVRKADPEAYALYCNRGATLTPNSSLVALANTPHWTAEHGRTRPTFGAVVMACPPSEFEMGGLPTQFLYFLKFKFPPQGVERGLGDVYRVSVYWDDTTDHKLPYGTSLSFFVDVRPDGNIKLLREANAHRIAVRSIAKRGGTFSVPSVRVGMPERVVSWAVDHGKTPEQMAATAFSIAAQFTALTSAGLRVRAERGGVPIVFSVDMLRTPYFFKDRDLEVNENGNRKKVFHIVRTFQRSDGRFVKTHFRGARRFSWNGYAVSITMPGLHHTDEADMDFTGEPSDEPSSNEPMLTIGELMADLDEQIKAA